MILYPPTKSLDELNALQKLLLIAPSVATTIEATNNNAKRIIQPNFPNFK
ncbi:Uncharacterised protein [Mycoplasmopsis edwardii]|uniref:Uncharacterized protein n=1 Tax=Mycoplasmopsis edwardii TaxID=53558 RepID=A0A3B0PLV1_9BACT|nr:Uncharacterised protein [Mycoplasmopsis edwardii]